MSSNNDSVVLTTSDKLELINEPDVNGIISPLFEVSARETLTNYDAFTQNGDRAYDQNNCHLLAFFSNVNRIGSDFSALEATILEHLPHCWREDPLYTLKLIFYKRDCRGPGSKEKKIFEISYRWLIENHYETAVRNLPHIPHFGSYKDLIKLLDTKLAPQIYDLFAETLYRDLLILQYQQMDPADISAITLASKWVPTVDSPLDKKYKFTRQIINRIKKRATLTFNCITDISAYRKQLLTPLRKHLRILETFMSSNRWSDIKYETVPSVAMSKQKKTFQKHDLYRFSDYLTQVAAGTKKINASQVFPHDLIRQHPIDTVAEEQWKVLVANTKKLGVMDRSVIVSDVSGSMSGEPMLISIALGILISDCCVGTFHNQVITFSESPSFFTLPETSLANKVRLLGSAPWGGNTNLVKTFEIILQRAIKSETPPDKMPTRLFIISDMQFDSASPGYNISCHDKIKAMYTEHKYEVPQIIFWNVSDNNKSLPVHNSELGTCCISGFATNILEVVLSGDLKSLHPLSMMFKVLNHPRYEVIQFV